MKLARPAVQLASAEFFLRYGESRFESSTGVIADRAGTRVTAEVVLLGRGEGHREAEMQDLRYRRRIEDLDLDRWVGEFENPGAPERTRLTISGIPVARVREKGGYLAHSGSMGGAMETALPDHELLGAIVEGPEGSVFFKLVGPAKTVDPIVGDFDRMIRSIKKKR